MPEPAGRDDTRTAACRPLGAGVWLVLLAPFYLNDLANIYVHDWRAWIAIDYLFAKALPLGVLGGLLAAGRVTPASLGLRGAAPRAQLATFALAAAVGVLLDQNGEAALASLPAGYPALGAIPAITSVPFRWLDLTLGLALVGFVEELLFRALPARDLALRGAPGWAVVAVTSLAFGLAHWSGGLHAVAVTGVIGAVFMLLYRRWQALPALALAHALVDFVAYSDVIPQAWFKLG